MKKNLPQNIESLYTRAVLIIEEARNTVYQAANAEMVKAYREIGREIVEEEQNGKERAEYGKALLQGLAEKLTKKYGKNYSNHNLRYMRQFYRIFQKWSFLSATKYIRKNERYPYLFKDTERVQGAGTAGRGKTQTVVSHGFCNFSSGIFLKSLALRLSSVKS